MNDIGKDGSTKRTNRNCDCCTYLGQIGRWDLYIRRHAKELYVVDSRRELSEKVFTIASYLDGKYRNDELYTQMYDLYKGEDNTSI